jgi:hypothetical protein
MFNSCLSHLQRRSNSSEEFVKAEICDRISILFHFVYKIGLVQNIHRVSDDEKLFVVVVERSSVAVVEILSVFETSFIIDVKSFFVFVDAVVVETSSGIDTALHH